MSDVAGEVLVEALERRLCVFARSRAEEGSRSLRVDPRCSIRNLIASIGLGGRIGVCARLSSLRSYAAVVS